jgi:hypothetical protein
MSVAIRTHQRIWDIEILSVGFRTMKCAIPNKSGVGAMGFLPCEMIRDLHDISDSMVTTTAMFCVTYRDQTAGH